MEIFPSVSASVS